MELLQEEVALEELGENGRMGLFRKRRPGSRVLLQFLGPSGCGKSTVLLALKDRLPNARFLAWCPDRGWPPVPRLEPGAAMGTGPLLLDDAHEMSRRIERLVCRYPLVAAATQVDLSRRFLRVGFRVETVDVGGDLDPGRLRRMVIRRMEWARRGPGPLPEIRVATLKNLLLEYGRNLRAIQADLYGMFQQLEARE